MFSAKPPKDLNVLQGGRWKIPVFSTKPPKKSQTCRGVVAATKSFQDADEISQVDLVALGNPHFSLAEFARRWVAFFSRETSPSRAREGGVSVSGA